MARLVGIDIRSTHVRGVLVRTSYRSAVLENMSEIARDQVPALEHAVQACGLPLVQHCDAVAVAVDGDLAFVHRFALPATAAKQLGEVIPFELEAQVPVDFEDVVFDYTTLPKQSQDDSIQVLAASARSETVNERIALFREATGHEPERVGCGAIPLANLAGLAPELTVPWSIAIADLGQSRTDVVVMNGGHPIFARTLSLGVGGLPESAPQLAAQLRQTFAAAGARAGDPIRTLFLAGGGAAAPGAETYLSAELGIEVSQLPPLRFEGLTPDQTEMAPRFAKAIGLALSLRAGPRDLDLRQGGLAYQRGFQYVKERAPLLIGLGATVLVSFFFSAWAELRSLGYEHEALTEQLAALTKRAFGEETEDPERAFELLEKVTSKSERDPMPKLDAFDVMVELSKAVPEAIQHDVDELDMSREQVKIRGIVGTTTEAQQVADNMKKNPCFKGVKISKVTQVVNSPKQKYVMDFEVKCPEEAKKKKAGDDSEEEE